MDQSAKTGRRLEISVARDRLKACLRLAGEVAKTASPPSVADVLVALAAHKIAVSDDVQARVAALVSSWSNPEDWPRRRAELAANEGVPLIEGRAPTEAQDGSFEWAPELRAKLAPTERDGAVDPFAASSIVTVTAGTVLGRLVPPKDGVAGTDVRGQPCAPRKLRGVALKLGPGVRLAAAESAEVVAETDGYILEEGGRLQIESVLGIAHDVDFSTGSIDTATDVVVHGTVRANFNVHTAKSLRVDRAIEAADVVAGADVLVRGGILGRDGQGHVKAGGRVVASFINETRLEAGGDVQFTKEVLNAHVRTIGHLIGERGTIIGGDVWAREGIRVRVLGSEACITTLVAVGTDLNLLRRARQMEGEIKDLQKAADQIRQMIQPLMANLKRLAPAQREQATEMMCRADEIEMRVADLAGGREQLVKSAAPAGAPFALVSEAIHPGVQLCVNTRVVRINRLLHGPVRIELRKINDVTEVAAVNQQTGSVTVLPSVEADLDVPLSDQRKGTAKHDADKSRVNHAT